MKCKGCDHSRNAHNAQGCWALLDDPNDPDVTYICPCNRFQRGDE